MALTLVNSFSATNTSGTNSTTPSITWTGSASVQFQIALIFISANTTISSTPAGWTNLTRAFGGSGANAITGFMSYNRPTRYPITGTTYSWTMAASGGWCVLLSQFADVTDSGSESAGFVAASGGFLSSPSLTVATPTGIKEMVTILGVAQNTATATALSGAANWVTGSGASAPSRIVAATGKGNGTQDNANGVMYQSTVTSPTGAYQWRQPTTVNQEGAVMTAFYYFRASKSSVASIF